MREVLLRFVKYLNAKVSMQMSMQMSMHSFLNENPMPTIGNKKTSKKRLVFRRFKP